MTKSQGRTALCGLGAVVVLVAQAQPAGAEPVPASCAPTERQWRVSFTIYRDDGKTRLGSVRSQGESRSNEQRLRSVTDFDDGSRWEEEAVVAITDTLRPLRYTRRFESGARERKSIEIDFARGVRTERSQEGEKSERVELPVDTYVGPMIGLIVRCAQTNGRMDFHSLSFENHPGLHAMMVRPLGEGVFPWGAAQGERAFRVLLKADLGAIGNFFLGGVIPDNTFWVSPDGRGTVLGWEGPSDWQAARIVAVRANRKSEGRKKAAEPPGR